MLGILFIYFIWKRFAELAVEFGQKKWLYGVIGVISYYLGSLIGGVVVGIAAYFFELNVDWENKMSMSIIAIPFGFGSCYIVYTFLNKKWEKDVVAIESIDDIGNTTSDE